MEPLVTNVLASGGNFRLIIEHISVADMKKPDLDLTPVGRPPTITTCRALCKSSLLWPLNSTISMQSIVCPRIFWSSFTLFSKHAPLL